MNKYIYILIKIIIILIIKIIFTFNINKGNNYYFNIFAITRHM